MTTTTHPDYRCRPGPLHSILLGGSVPLFLGALLSDIAYSNTFQIQWANFAAWLIAGGLLFAGLALLFALANLIRAEHKGGRPLVYFGLLLITWIIGLVNAFEHAKDAYAVMPAGLWLSVIIAVLAVVTAWLGLSNLRNGGVR